MEKNVNYCSTKNFVRDLESHIKSFNFFSFQALPDEKYHFHVDVISPRPYPEFFVSSVSCHYEECYTSIFYVVTPMNCEDVNFFFRTWNQCLGFLNRYKPHHSRKFWINLSKNFDFTQPDKFFKILYDDAISVLSELDFLLGQRTSVS